MDHNTFPKTVYVGIFAAMVGVSFAQTDARAEKSPTVSSIGNICNLSESDVQTVSLNEPKVLPMQEIGHLPGLSEMEQEMPKTEARVAVNENGIAYIAGTRMKVKQIVRETTMGYTPEDILDSHSHLSLPQIHAALDYYYTHKHEIDRQIENDDQRVNELRARHPNPITRETLLHRQERS